MHEHVDAGRGPDRDANRCLPRLLRAQALLVAGWWSWLWLDPSARALFLPADWPEAALLAFALPDFLVLVAGSALAAHGFARGAGWARPALAVVFGGALYAALWCTAAWLLTGSGALAATAMLPCAAANGGLWWRRR